MRTTQHSSHMSITSESYDNISTLVIEKHARHIDDHAIEARARIVQQVYICECVCA